MDINGHVAYRRKNGAKAIVICVHGIQGSPRQFDWLVERLPEDVDYECVLLPGHGATVQDFRKNGAAEWETHIRKLCADAAKQYERIIYIGHSMGCLLGIFAAVGGIRFDGMLMLACPLALKPTLRYFINNLRAVGAKNPSDPYVKAVQRANSVHAASSLQYLSCIRPYLELLKLIRRTRRIAAKLEAPAVLLHSENDEIVGRRSMDIFRDVPHVKTAVLPSCGHFLYTDEAKESIRQELRKMLESMALQA